MLKKGLLVVSVVFLAAAAANAQITVSAGFALSLTSANDNGRMGLDSSDMISRMGVGGNIYADYLLPVGIPLSLGIEVGVDSAFSNTTLAIPLLARVAYHFDITPKIDLYLVGKAGYAFGIWRGEERDQIEASGGSVGKFGGFSFGFDVGAAYYFSSFWGVFIEAGFDQYGLTGKVNYGYGGGEEIVKIPFRRIVTLGVSFKR